jgi:hypothetical protein
LKAFILVEFRVGCKDSRSEEGSEEDDDIRELHRERRLLRVCVVWVDERWERLR